MKDIIIFNKYFSKISRTSILVIGDIILDEFVFGEITKISPEGSVPIFEKKEENIFYLGGAANVANNLKKLGANVFLLGVIGKDEAGQKVKKLLKENQIDDYLIEEDYRKTSHKTRFCSENNSFIRVDQETRDEILEESRKQIEEKLKGIISKIKGIICSDYEKGVLSKELIENIIKKAKDIPVFIDPKGSKYSKYEGCTIIKPNIKELEVAVGRKIKNEMDIIQSIKDLFYITKTKYVLVTRGKEGLLYSSFDFKKSFKYIQAKEKSVFDVTGAGDTVIGLFGLCYSLGIDPFNSAKIANTAAGIVVEKRGTATLSIKELEEELSDQERNEKIYKACDLVLKLQILDKKNKIVFTNGCFDVLHAGHLYLLQEAKKFGEILIVGINSDKSIKKIKGEHRPIIIEKERAEMLAALSVVDYVVIFDEEDPLNIIKILEPDVLVKGGDYTFDTIVGSDFVKRYGGKVEIIPYLEGKSTTNILEKIK